MDPPQAVIRKDLPWRFLPSVDGGREEGVGGEIGHVTVALLKFLGITYSVLRELLARPPLPSSIINKSKKLLENFFIDINSRCRLCDNCKLLPQNDT